MMGDLLIFTLKFILCLKIHYIMSQKEQNIERDLLGSLLDGTHPLTFRLIIASSNIYSSTHSKTTHGIFSSSCPF